MRTKWLSMSLIAAGISSASYAQQRDAASQAQATPNTLTPAEAQLVNKLHADNLKDIAAGKYATSHARNEAVKKYGQELERQHSQADRELQTLVSQAGLKLREPQTDAWFRGMTKTANPATFDRPFLIQMANTQDDALAQVQKAQATVVNPALQTLLKRSEPILQQDRDQAVRLLENTL